jgi:hypothetical protein
MRDKDAVGTLEELAIGLDADEAGMRRFAERVAAHHESATLRDALAEVGARMLLDSSEAYLAEAVDAWRRDRGGQPC